MSAIQDLVGHNIKFFRQLRGLTQEHLAEMANVSSAYIGYLERGKKSPSLEVLVKIADVLNINPSQLLMPIEEDNHELTKFVSLIADKGNDFFAFINSVADAYFKSVNAIQSNKNFTSKHHDSKSFDSQNLEGQRLGPRISTMMEQNGKKTIQANL